MLSLKCRDMGTPDCDYVVKGDTEEEVLQNGFITSSAGDSEVLKFQGIGRSIVPGFRASYRGSTFRKSASPRFSKLLNSMTVWEVDIDEAGNFLLKIWEWK